MSDYVSFADVIAEVTLEGAEPTYEVLLRWQKRYPEFRENLADFFALKAIQREPIDELPDIDEEEIAEYGKQYAMALLEEQGRIIPDNHVEPVGGLDQIVLGSVCLLEGKADAAKLVEQVGDMAGKAVNLGFILRSLSKLEEKYLIESWEADSGAFYYSITIVGERALAFATETSRVVAGLLGDLA
jgi:hypothetical protein